VTVCDPLGYPVSVRQTSPRYDADTGQLRVVLPDMLEAIEGPATVLCHIHDDKLWNLNAIQIKGRLERHSAEWVFVTTAFTPPSKWQPINLFLLAKRGRAAANSYLKKRGLARPVVDWQAIHELRPHT
jgi:hypothetical protein